MYVLRFITAFPFEISGVIFSVLLCGSVWVGVSYMGNWRDQEEQSTLRWQVRPWLPKENKISLSFVFAPRISNGLKPGYLLLLVALLQLNPKRMWPVVMTSPLTQTLTGLVALAKG